MHVQRASRRRASFGHATISAPVSSEVHCSGPKLRLPRLTQYEYTMKYCSYFEFGQRAEKQESDTPRRAGGLMSGAASKAVTRLFRRRAEARLGYGFKTV